MKLHFVISLMKFIDIVNMMLSFTISFVKHRMV
jgi:hypothetical protein